MNTQMTNDIKEDFEVWSGGFPPESEYQIWAYIETALPNENDDEDIRRILREWMQGQN